MAKDNGGAAFPCEGGVDSGLHPDAGLTARDYFAAKAMQGFIAANSNSLEWIEVATKSALAKRSYEIADTMLAERNK